MNVETDLNSSNSPKVIVVEASAGSGKTRALAKRYLYLLINSDFKKIQNPLRDILAITFTNRATLEMKERILEFLKRIALDSFSDPDEEKDIFDFLGLDKQKAQSKALGLMDAIITNYNFFQVQTIDSFIHSLLLGCAIHINRSASFKIKRNYENYLSYCLDLVIEQAHTQAEVFEFLEDFLEHYLFVENREGWFPRDDILQLMRSLFRLSNKYGKRFAAFEGLSLDVIKKKKHIYKQISNLSLDFPEGLNAKAKKSIIRFLDKNKDIFDTSSLPTALMSPFARMNKESLAGNSFSNKWKNIFEQLKELIELEATVAYNPYIKLFNRLAQFFQAVSRKEDILFLEELNAKARLLFVENGITIAEAYYRLATRFRHYLIDEFQDTSLLQWHNLYEMVKEGLSTGGTFFYVGDKKQAIYRFRGGQARLFDDVKKEFSQFGVRGTNLAKNWRSQKEIVNFNNRIFSKENLKEMLIASEIVKELTDAQSVEDIVSIFKDSFQQHKVENDFGYVQIERINEKNQQERDAIMQEKILKLIKKLSRRFREKDIAILTRDNSEVELVTSWLLGAGMSVESEKTLNVVENNLTKELIYFLKFLHSPIDDLSFSAFILGDIFSAVSGIPKDDIRDFLFTLHKERKFRSKKAVYKSFSQEFPQQWEECIDKFLKAVGFISPYELLVSIYQRFDLMRKFKDSQGFFMKFLELVKTNEDEYTGLGDFLLYLKDPSPDDLYVNAAHSDSVKVLTIHKAKGLEFAVVIIPFLRIDIVPETAGKGTNSHVVNEEGPELGLMRITKVYRSFSPLLQKIYSQDYKKACIDELNNIYVALTRAQYELYAFIPKKSSNSTNKVRFLIPEDIKIQGLQKKYKHYKRDKDQLFIGIPCSVYKDWIEALKDEFGDAKEVENREKILEGNFLHAVFSRVGNCQKQDLDSLIIKAIKFAKLKYPFFEISSVGICEKVKQVISAENLRDIFYISEGDVFCEKEVANSFGDLKRIDRLIVKDDEVWIVDYKLSRIDEQQHKKQVNEYIRIISDIYPRHKVRGILVYLDELKKAEVTAT